MKSKMHKWFCFDNELGIESFATEKEAIERATDICKSWIGGNNTWDQEVNSIKVGKITHVAAQTNIVKNTDKINAGIWPKHLDYKCDYEMKEIIT